MSKPTFNPWKTLGVNLQSDDAEVRAAYIKLAQAHHPDKGGEASMFTKVTEAYKLLTDRKRRSVYIKDLSIWNECCSACKGKGVLFKQKGLLGREQKTCSMCDGAGVIIEEERSYDRKAKRKSSRVAPGS